MNRDTQPTLDTADTLPPPANDTEDEPTPTLGVIPQGTALRATEDILAELVMTLVTVPMVESDRVEVAAAYLHVESLMRAMARTLDLQREIVIGD